MAGGLSSCLPIAMRMVGDAIRLDSQNCKKEAYCQYLSCCIYISQILKDDAWDKDLKLTYNNDSTKLFKLMQQCQERALTIITSEGLQPTNNQHTESIATPPGRPATGTLRTSSGHLLNFPSPPPSSPPTANLSNSMKPCPRGNYQDRRLMGHHLRVAKANTSNTDKTLTYLRRMSENLQIAKAREEAIRKKVWERQQRLQQEANRRFASASVDSKEEQEQKILYTKILEFEQDMVWPRQLRAKLKESPEDATLIKHIIDKIFSSKDHPLKQFLVQYQYHVYRKLLPLLKDVNFPSEKNLSAASQDDISTRTTETCSNDNSGKDFNRDYENHEMGTKEKDNTGKSSSEERTDVIKELNDFQNFKDNNTVLDNTEENMSKMQNNDNSGNNQQAFNQEDIKTIVNSVIADILEKVTESAVNEEQKDVLLGELQEGLSNASVTITNKGQELHMLNETESTKHSSEFADENSCQENEPSSTAVINNTRNKEIIKNRNLLRIKSFDVDSEFESLEDDMFDSESSESEEEQVEKLSDKQSTLSKSTQEDNTAILDKESENEGSKDTEGLARKDSVKEQTEPKLSYEEDLEMTRKQLNEIFVDMRFFLEKLKGFIILAYEELATPVGHDQCYAAVEYPFFQPLWPLLLGVLRRVNFDKELSLGVVMTKRIHKLPAEMGVINRLCLSDQESVKLTGNQYPYQSAVDLLQKVATSNSPLEKLDYIVHVLRSICQCVEDYWEIKGKPRHCPETSMGCDDLLPVLTYVIVRSGMAQLVSECFAMEEFIPEGYLMGEEGYCLTTLQTALSYLVNLDTSTQLNELEEKPESS